MSMEIKRVVLERQTTTNNPNGTFGFSVLGGAGTKFPAVVCEVDTGGPADRCQKVREEMLYMSIMQVCTCIHLYCTCIILLLEETSQYGDYIV